MGVVVVGADIDGRSGGAAEDERDDETSERVDGRKGMLESLASDDVVALYFRDVRPIPLLNREQEIELAKQIELGESARQRLDEQDVAGREQRRLEQQVRRGDRALQRLIESNFRLVISIARQYVGQGVPLPDLIQEGNLGLMRAARKFDYRLGNKFSTYATWWIRQAVRRGIADQGQTIRVPVHMRDRIYRLNRLTHDLEKQSGQEPTAEDLAEVSPLSLEQVELALHAAHSAISLEQPKGEDAEQTLGDFIASEDTPYPDDEIDDALLEGEIRELLTSLTLREARIITLRYGLNDGRERSLKEVGDQFGLTRERIRQIEGEALRKLRYPPRSQHLRAYLN